MLPEISIVLPVYNGEEFLSKAVNSILRQTFKNFELIIINDGSTDNSLNIIKSFKDSRIIIIDQEQNGLAQTLKNTIPICKGIFIARMDQDDISNYNRLETQYDYLKNNKNVSVVSNAVSFIDKDDNYLGRTFPPTNENAILYSLLNEGCVINHPSVMFRKLDYLKTEGYSVEVGDIFTDYFLWITFIKKGLKIHNIKSILLEYRILHNSLSSTSSLNKYETKILYTLLNAPIHDLEIKEKLKNLYLTAKNNNYKNRKLQSLNILNKLFNIFNRLFGYKNAELFTIAFKNYYILSKSFFR
jgi:glycosyltransferase involved in cell wall biosynthesis